jgi:DedD protein
MGLFSRDKEAVEANPADDVPFQALRRSPRNARKPRASGSGGGFDAGVPLDPADASRTRARRRLIGAVALALAAIVFVPMLFDRTPVAPTDDIGLQIPERDTPFEGRRGVPDPGRSPLKSSGELPSTPNASAPVVESVAPAVPDTAAPTPAMSPTPDTPAETVVPPKPAAGAVAKAAGPAPAEKLSEKPAAKSAEKSASAMPADDPRALAALEGKDESTPSRSGDAHQYAVQIAAFSAPERAKGLRDQLVANGLKAYTESVSTTQGERTRVRLGPFTSRDAADRAKATLKTMKLDGSVVPL